MKLDFNAFDKMALFCSIFMPIITALIFFVNLLENFIFNAIMPIFLWYLSFGILLILTSCSFLFSAIAIFQKLKGKKVDMTFIILSWLIAYPFYFFVAFSAVTMLTDLGALFNY
ncbi:MAG: hypothetical protein AABX74_03565 [Nanoarchaeota archaeon]